jgi:selenocysteine lyase/cysteine desulfurase
MNDTAKARLHEYALIDGNGNARFVVMHGMFATSLEVKVTTTDLLSFPEVVGFVRLLKALASCGDVRRDDCSALDTRRQRLKARFLAGLAEISPESRISSPIGRRHSNFIASFQIPEMDNREVVERLWREHLVFASYIARTNLIRFSFGQKTSAGDVDQAADAVREICLSHDNAKEAPDFGHAEPGQVTLAPRRRDGQYPLTNV